MRDSAAKTDKEATMEDAYERRALLVHLGEVLQTLCRIVQYESGDATVGDLLADYEILSDVPLVEHVSDLMPIREFETAVMRAFCLWPQQLLETPLDHEALASPVRRNLFADNPHGWDAYAATLRSSVPWFGKSEASASARPGAADAADHADVEAPVAESPDIVDVDDDWHDTQHAAHTDIERNGARRVEHNESIEGLASGEGGIQT
jgi:hypothetical protein